MINQMNKNGAAQAPPPDFKQRPMVKWFNPGQLLDTAMRAVLSEIFGAYTDKREIQAALEATHVYNSISGKDELWIDYVADLGDGFDSTYTVAKLLAEGTRVYEYESKSFVTRRGNILIMGGDQVYPAAKREEYRDRLLGPYAAALPSESESEAPQLFAIPGNHDWYDGLTNFMRTFCQQQWIGGWRTRQSRSYFAIKLPHHWWLWGIDIQLKSRIDKPQLDYFEAVAQHVAAGDQIILCTAEPSWVHAEGQDSEAYKNLAYFQNKIIGQSQARLVLTLTGDLHHYCHYAAVDGTDHKITAGGGGAYLRGTHELPRELRLPDGAGERTYTREAVFPDEPTSRRKAWGALLFPFNNFKFSFFLGSFYLVLSWLIQTAAISSNSGMLELMRHTLPGTAGSSRVLERFLFLLINSPSCWIFLIALVGGLIAFCDAKPLFKKIPVGALHAAAHLVLYFSLMWLLLRFNAAALHLALGTFPHFLIFAAEMTTLGGFLGAILFSLYLLLSHFLLRLHPNEVFACQSIPHYKNFVRLRLDPAGNLTVFAIGIKQVVKNWRLVEAPDNGQSYYEPANGERIVPHLLEEPFVIPGSVRKAASKQKHEASQAH